MEIHRLTIENFRCFSEKTIDFAPQFNVLIGDNGSGKTAVLDALAVSVGAFLLGIDSHSARDIRQDDARRVSRLISGVPTLEAQYPVRARTDGTVNGEKLTWRRSLTGEGKRTTLKLARSIRDVAAELQEQVRNHQDATLPLIAYYGTGRMWYQTPRYVIVRKSSNGGRRTSSTETTTPGSRLDGYSKCLDAETNQKFLNRWLKTYELSALQRRTPNTALQGIKEAVARCMDHWTKITYDILLDELLAEDDEGNRMPVRLLSDGQRNILYMVLDLAYRAVTLNPHFEDKACQKTPGVVLIDEIDLHLHPKWQRRVVGDLRTTFPGIQFISTTHSPAIVQSLCPGELIDLNDGEPGDYVGRSPEDILEQVMDVELPQRSLRSKRMIAAAEEYYKVLQEAKTAPDERLDELKQRLDELMEPFADNEAYIAFLRQERIAAGVGAD